ncbi:MAG TPA: heme-binding domain-containing protein [Verrucomicrobiae bacterium]|nr:heme-binding domain-containing protein [Verrucomicrobiae bacterium]
MKCRLKWFLIAVLAAFALLQLTNAGHTNPAVTPGHDMLSTNPPPPQITAILRNACYDCHSYETRWPWYGHVVPVSWWLNSHVVDARERLNFSEWPHNDAQKAAKKWTHISDSVREGDMPLPSYAKIHKAARLTGEQRNALADWADAEANRLKALATNSP